jgi:hypothetical protein
MTNIPYPSLGGEQPSSPTAKFQNSSLEALLDVFSLSLREQLKPMFRNSVMATTTLPERRTAFSSMTHIINSTHPREHDAVIRFHHAFMTAELTGPDDFDSYARALVAHAAGFASKSLQKIEESLACHALACSLVSELALNDQRNFVWAEGLALQTQRLAELERVDLAVAKLDECYADAKLRQHGWIRDRCWSATSAVAWMLLDLKPPRTMDVTSLVNRSLALFTNTSAQTYPITNKLRIDLFNVLGSAAYRRHEYDAAHAEFLKVLPHANSQLALPAENPQATSTLLQGASVNFDRKRPVEMALFMVASMCCAA